MRMSKTASGPELVTVYETGNLGAVAVAKSLLESVGIKYLVKGEGIQDLFGIGRIGSMYNMVTGPIQIQVLKGNAEDARELLADLEDSMKLGIGDGE